MLDLKYSVATISLRNLWRYGVDVGSSRKTSSDHGNLDQHT